MKNSLLDRPFDLTPRQHPNLVVVYKSLLIAVTFVVYVYVIPKFQTPFTEYDPRFLFVALFLSLLALGIIHGTAVLKQNLYPPRYLFTIKNTLFWEFISFFVTVVFCAILMAGYRATAFSIQADFLSYAYTHIIGLFIVVPVMVIYRAIYLRRRKFYFISRIKPKEMVNMTALNEEDELRFQLDELLYFEQGKDRVVLIHCKHPHGYKKYVLNHTLHHLEALFFRLPIVWMHDQYLINLMAIDSIKSHGDNMHTLRVKAIGKHLPISRGRVKLLKKQLSKLNQA